MKVLKWTPISEYFKSITVDYKKAKKTRDLHNIDYIAGHLDINKENRHDIMISTDELGNNRVSYIWADGGIDEKFRKELIVLDDYGAGWYGISFPILQYVDKMTYYFHYQIEREGDNY